MVGEASAGQPVLPVVGGPDQPVGIFVAGGRGMLAPGHGDETRVAFLEQRPGSGAGTLEAEVEVGGQLELDVRARCGGDTFVVALAGVLPARLAAAVVENRLAVEHQLDLAVDAAHHAQEHVVGVVVGGGVAMRVRPVALVVPGTDQEHVPDDDPAVAGSPSPGSRTMVPGR